MNKPIVKCGSCPRYLACKRMFGCDANGNICSDENRKMGNLNNYWLADSKGNQIVGNC